jgi:hypothetical protein
VKQIGGKDIENIFPNMVLQKKNLKKDRIEKMFFHAFLLKKMGLTYSNLKLSK